MGESAEYLRQIRDLIASRGPTDKRNMPTSQLGVETPLIIADVVSKNPTDLIGCGSYLGLETFTVSHYTDGQVLVSIDSKKPSGLITYGAEIRVTALCGANRDILGVGFANTATGPFRVLLPLGTVYNTITIEARQIVNGAPSSANPDNDSTMVGAILKAQYSARVYR